MGPPLMPWPIGALVSYTGTSPWSRVAPVSLIEPVACARHASTSKIAELINAHRDEIAFVKNTTEGISFVANGLGGPNPTLTLQALAARTADEIARRTFG